MMIFWNGYRISIQYNAQRSDKTKTKYYSNRKGKAFQLQRYRFHSKGFFHYHNQRSTFWIFWSLEFKSVEVSRFTPNCFNSLSHSASVAFPYATQSYFNEEYNSMKIFKIGVVVNGRRSINYIQMAKLNRRLSITMYWNPDHFIHPVIPHTLSSYSFIFQLFFWCHLIVAH